VLANADAVDETIGLGFLVFMKVQSLFYSLFAASAAAKMSQPLADQRPLQLSDHALPKDMVSVGEHCAPIKNAINYPAICEHWKPLSSKVAEVMPHVDMLAVVGGDHSIETGVLRGLAKENGGKPVPVVYFDGHADINSPKTSPSGNVHGMPLWFALKENNIDPKLLTYVAMRHPDPGEVALLHKLKILVYSVADVRKRGAKTIADEMKARFGENLHVSFDVDVFDESLVPGTGTPEPKGLTRAEGLEMVEVLAPKSLSLVEVDPERDMDNKTIRLGNEVLLRAAKGHKTVGLISAGSHLGQTHPGPEKAPEAILKSGLLDQLKRQGATVAQHVVPPPRPLVVH